MSIAITEEHQALAETVSDFLTQKGARDAARALLDGADDARPAFWDEAAALGWLGLHLPEAHGGSGYGLAELVVVVEELGRAVTPGPFVPTMIASAVIADAAEADLQAKWLPGLGDGSTVAGVALAADVTVDAGSASGSIDVVMSGGLADILVVPVGEDVAIIEVGQGVTVTTPPALDVSRPSSRVELDGASCSVIAGGRQTLLDLGRVILSAEAVGVARECTTLASQYAVEREQFGRVIAMFQAVKHHCANMVVATELATSAVWDAARASKGGGKQRSFAAAVAASLAAPAADLCANLNTQVHGGIAITWEHDAHLYMRRPPHCCTCSIPREPQPTWSISPATE